MCQNKIKREEERAGHCTKRELLRKFELKNRGVLTPAILRLKIGIQIVLKLFKIYFEVLGEE